MESLKRWARRVVKAPEHEVPTVSTKDVFTGYQKNPAPLVVRYLKSLFPIIQWAPNYNLGWLSGDFIAGLTVGMVLVPQGMSYAKLASLPPQYGLYSSFVGVFIYAFFATSKDVSIGPVAVMSLEVGQIIGHIQDSHPGQWTNPQIATTIAFVCGFIVLGIGLLRLGWIVEFIPTPAVAGFMTGSALSIVSGQVPSLLGISSRLDTRASTYLVIINTLKNLPYCTKDAAFGLVGLFFLYFFRWLFSFLTKRYPSKARLFFFLSVSRNAFVIVILTLSSFLYIHLRHEKPDSKDNYSISILKTVPRGFQHIGSPTIDPELVKALGPDLFVASIILLLEHIAIGKSFGRLNGYKINPNQELIAMGVTNTVGTVFGAYPATGSFSRTALKSKCGVRTPAAGWVTGIVVIVALYGFTDAFFFIPNAGLSAIIIHAVADLVTPPSQVYAFWRINPLEFGIWAAGVLVSVFATIEYGIYATISLSILLLLIRVAHPGGHFLGKVPVRAENEKIVRDVFVPVDKTVTRNPHIKFEPFTPGVFVYRLEESFTYPNCSIINSTLVDYIKKHTRRGKDASTIRLVDRPWNEPAPRSGIDPAAHDASKPLLRAIVLDFSAVPNVDTTGVQILIDTRRELEKWADGPVEFHFATILSPWVRRALLAGGFGIGDGSHIPIEVAPVVPAHDQEYDQIADDWRLHRGSVHQDRNTSGDDLEGNGDDKVNPSDGGRDVTEFSSQGPLVSTLTPFFHVDLPSAVRAAEARATKGKDSKN